jgi:ribonucleoside-diphosphate reductase alpha chain
MSDLVPGDLVIGRFQESHGPGGAPLDWIDRFRTSANEIPTPRQMTPAFARLLGMLAADGSTHEPTGCVELTCKNDYVEREFRRLCADVFGVGPDETVDHRNGVKYLRLTSRNLVRFIESLIGHGAYGKHAPDALLRGSFEEKRNFLEGITLDGYATRQGLVLYGGMSKTLAYHVAEIARSFGLPWVAQGRKWVSESDAYAYDVVISNELQEIVTPVEPHKRSAVVYKRYKVLADMHGVDRSQYRARTREYYAVRSAQARDARHVFNSTAALLDLSADTLVHEITVVEPAGELELYDVEVEHAHEYVVNGMVSHNTTNFAHTATVEDVRAIYELAYELKAKGVTVYRDGSRDNQVLSTGATEKAKAEREKGGAPAVAAVAAAAPGADVKREIGELQGTLAELRAELERTRRSLFEAEAENLQRRAKRARPDRLRGTTIRKETPLGTMFVNITEDDRGQPFEVFLTLGKAGGSAMADAEAMGRLISLALRSGIPLMEIHKQLRGISSDRAVGLGPNKVLSVPDAIGIALEEWWREKQGVQQDLLGDVAARLGGPPSVAPPASSAPAAGTSGQQPMLSFEAYDSGAAFMGTCPDCGSQMEYAEGCVKCHVCGFSECG